MNIRVVHEESMQDDAGCRISFCRLKPLSLSRRGVGVRLNTQSFGHNRVQGFIMKSLLVRYP